jgi:hypothetical protein
VPTFGTSILAREKKLSKIGTSILVGEKLSKVCVEEEAF